MTTEDKAYAETMEIWFKTQRASIEHQVHIVNSIKNDIEIQSRRLPLEEEELRAKQYQMDVQQAFFKQWLEDNK